MTARDVAIVVPSAGRATSVLTRIAGMVLFVPESQANAYRKQNTGVRVESHPDDAYATLGAKRQAVYERWGDVFLVDDDIVSVSRVYREGEDRDLRLSPGEAAELIQQTALDARDAGCYLFGFSQSAKHRDYSAHAPVSLTSHIDASAMGLLQSDRLYFSERLTAGEGDWMNLLNARMHRRSWSDLRFCFVQGGTTVKVRPGGRAGQRTAQSERDDTLHLRRMFGQAVQQKAATGAAAEKVGHHRIVTNPLARRAGG